MHISEAVSSSPARAQQFVLEDLGEPIAPATPVTSVAGGVLLVVIVLAMVPGAVDTSYRKSPDPQ
ncbi:hypothetical protein [Sorangium sp. So ce394]|uniref:hypothetical protein n=1 Tax=Sorangium sp. So ce394 TaxID=3133310 RepID=UPI003F5CB7FB